MGGIVADAREASYRRRIGPLGRPLEQRPGLRVRGARSCEPFPMFGMFKRDPAAKVQKQYEAVMKEAIELQRSGDIRGFAAKSEEAAELEKRLAALETAKKGGA